MIIIIILATQEAREQSPAALRAPDIRSGPFFNQALGVALSRAGYIVVVPRAIIIPTRLKRRNSRDVRTHIGDGI